jgi:hypothetical protein
LEISFGNVKHHSLPFSHHGCTAIQRCAALLFDDSSHVICLSHDQDLFGDFVIVSGSKYHHREDCLLHDLFENCLARSPPVFLPCQTFTACSTVLFSIFITKKRFFHFFFVKSTTVRYFVL